MRFYILKIILQLIAFRNMTLQEVILKLEAANTIVASNKRIPFSKEWKLLNNRYFIVKGNRKQFLIPKDPNTLHAAENLLKIRPFLEQLGQLFLDKEARNGHHLLAIGLIDCIIINMMFEPIVYRYGLKEWGKDLVLKWNFSDLSFDGAAKWADYQYCDKTHKNGLSPLRTWSWSFPNFDEYRVFWDI